jgi:hypothetical protein
MQYNTCHNRNIKLIITILQKYYTGLHRFVGIETKVEFKYKQKIKQQKQKWAGFLEGNRARYQNLARPS